MPMEEEVPAQPAPEASQGSTDLPLAQAYRDALRRKAAEEGVEVEARNAEIVKRGDHERRERDQQLAQFKNLVSRVEREVRERTPPVGPPRPGERPDAVWATRRRGLTPRAPYRARSCGR